MSQFVLSLADERATTPERTGGKGANLARLVRAGFPVPPGSCVTTAVYEAFVDTPELETAIASVEALDVEEMAAIAEASSAVRSKLRAREVPVPVRRALRDALDDLDGRAYAVRSSATAEDLPTASFAGQHETFLGVGEAEVLDRVRDCLVSLFTDRAVTYRLRNGISHSEVAMAVVVQPMVDPSVAGVLFTADPVSGNRTVASVDANFGLGDTVVAGEVSPDNARVDRRSGAVLDYEVGEKRYALRSRGDDGCGTESVEHPAERRESRALTDAQLRALVDVGDRVEELFGSPQDIEWALVDGTFVLLQSRPITSLFPLPSPPPGDDRLHVYLSFGHAQAMPEALPPLVVDFWRGFLEGGAKTVRSGDEGDPWALDAGGRVYVDLTPMLGVGALRRVLPGRLAAVNEPAAAGLTDLLNRRPEAFPDRGLLADLRTVASAARNGRAVLLGPLLTMVGRILRDLLVGPPAAERERDWIERWGEAEAARVREPESPAERVRVAFERTDISLVLTQLFPRIGAHLLAGVLARKALGRLFPTADAELDALGKGFEMELVTRMNQRLGDLADLARAHSAVREALLEGRSRTEVENVEGGQEFEAALRGYLDEFGHRATGEIDLRRPRWRDDPETLLRTVRSALERDESGTHRAHLRRLERAATEAADHLEARAARGVLGPVRKAATRRLIRTYRDGVQLREYPKQGMAHLFAAVHDELADVGEALAADGRLDRVDDVWYLREVELLDVLETGTRPAVAVAARRRDLRHNTSMTAPALLTSEGESPTVTGEVTSEDGVLTGTPVSSGVVEGVARVVRDPTSESLGKGEILVAPSTDPGWTPLFLNAAGLVMEVGGRMTHGALVAREYGIPAVAAVSGATTTIRTGERVRVDGKRGTVELLERGGEDAERPTPVSPD